MGLTLQRRWVLAPPPTDEGAPPSPPPPCPPWPPLPSSHLQQVLVSFEQLPGGVGVGVRPRSGAACGQGEAGRSAAQHVSCVVRQRVRYASRAGAGGKDPGLGMARAWTCAWAGAGGRAGLAIARPGRVLQVGEGEQAPWPWQLPPTFPSLQHPVIIQSLVIITAQQFMAPKP